MSVDMLRHVIASIKDVSTKSTAEKPFVKAHCVLLEDWLSDDEDFATYPTYHIKGAPPSHPHPLMCSCTPSPRRLR